jgi:hypothetical protein
MVADSPEEVADPGEVADSKWPIVWGKWPIRGKWPILSGDRLLGLPLAADAAGEDTLALTRCCGWEESNGRPNAEQVGRPFRENGPRGDDRNRTGGSGQQA